MASKNYYSATYFDDAGSLCAVRFPGKAAALKHGANLPGLVRVATPAGALVRYFDNRKKG